MDTSVVEVNNSVHECKIVLVGDVKCGKTSLIQRVLHDKFQDVYVPTGFERYTAVYEVGAQRINFTVWDTAGSSAYDIVRPLSYQDCNVFLLCFQINQPDSLENTVNKWLPEVGHYAPNVPIVLCGCQSDTRHDLNANNTQPPEPTGFKNSTGNNRHSPITLENAVEISRQIGAATYVETSSKLSEKTAREAFEVAALVALGRLNKNHGTIQRDRSFDSRMATRSKSKLDLKSELKDKTKNCSLM